MLDLQTFSPDSLDSSLVILIGVKENAGQLAGEIGPIGRDVTANVSFYDNLEVPTSLPDASLSCARFGSLIPGATDSLVPTGFPLMSSGVLRLVNVQAGSTPIGIDTWVYGFHGQAVGRYGGSSSAKYLVVEPDGIPTPTPATTPTPGPTGSATPQPTATEPGQAPTPTPGGLTPTPGAPTPTGGATPTPQGSATPSPSSTPAPSVTPTAAPTGSPTPAGQSCTTVSATLTLDFDTGGGTTIVNGIEVELKYPQTLDVPGFGSDATVLSSVTNLTGVSDGVFSAADSDTNQDGMDDLISVGLVRISLTNTLPPGSYARVKLSCREGATVPSASAFTCTPDVTDVNGLSVTATCSVAVSTP
jgi:hypothetical protein